MGLAAPLAYVWLALATAAEDPKLLVERAIESGLGNRAKSANWLGREDIKRYALDKRSGGRRKMESWVTYEASKLEGQNYYKVIARDGKPLSPKDAAKEQQRMDAEAVRRRTHPAQRGNDSTAKRFSISLQQLLVFHALQWKGQDTVHGRKISIVEAELRSFAPRPRRPDDLALIGDLTLWIDQETGLVCMQELRVTREWGNYTPGSMIRYDLDWNGEVMLPSKISITMGSHYVEQVYTSYHHFGADAVIQFDTGTTAPAAAKP
jgi:hypothetical protein